MITILSGSPRKNSITSRVAKAIQQQILSENHDMKVEMIDFADYDIPNFNQEGIKKDALTIWQSHLINSLAASKLVFFLTPEYNWMPSAEALQMIHVLGSNSFKEIWDNKVFATCGTSTGRGGRMPAIQLSNTINKVIHVFNFESMVSAKMFESQFTDKALDANGNSIGNSEYDKGLKAFVDYSLNISERWHR
ncbi:MAG: NAD(P)H-dependent oxidoreductase [Bacteroidota bacterium]|nr:NAD(P)H-dependent oxidoreductase [Bacteroidota bacterium]